MPNEMENKFALAAVWAMFPTLGGALGFFAIGYYKYLLATILTGVISWSLLKVKRSRKIFMCCVVLSALIGVVCRQFFSIQDGAISGAGVALLVLPMMATNVFMVLRIYFIETKTSS